MRVLLTGGTGFLGSHIAEQLRGSGHEVRVLARRTSHVEPLRAMGCEIAYAVLERGEGLEEAVRGVDAVVHAAALVKARRPEEFHEVNAGGTERLLEAVERAAPGVRRFVLVSSLAAHGFAEGGPRSPDAEPAPVTHYGRSKLAAERATLARADRFPVTVIRPPAIYGPRDREMFAFFKIVRTGIVPFIGNPENRMSLIYGPDAADAVVRALRVEHPSGRIYSVEDGRAYSQRQFVDAIAAALGVRYRAITVPVSVVSMAAWLSELGGALAGRAVMLTRDKVNELRVEQLVYAADAIREELGWNARVQLEEGARLSVEWYRAHGWL
ncbi:MAG: NAD-dependent epimerase/dehydratase family protein [Myxococcota bacterium]|nr:NAD-dependent epimerase/dehydratase family protein [Myxococcota bacterium]MDW8363878.1 NAD-dependent epimerase/dehydratase family protein [Myxococcales bacterium]